MSARLSDTDLIQAISRVIAEEEFASDAIARVRQILAPTDMDGLKAELRVLIAAVDVMLEPKPSRGRIEFEDSVVEIPDEENRS